LFKKITLKQMVTNALHNEMVKALNLQEELSRKQHQNLPDNSDYSH
jgi:hypothetical protein